VVAAGRGLPTPPAWLPRCVSVTLRVKSAMLRAKESSVMAPPDGDAASERTDDTSSLPAVEASSDPAAGAMAGCTNGAGGGPDISDTRCYGSESPGGRHLPTAGKKRLISYFLLPNADLSTFYR
jgi:hypothetical protein